MNILNRKNLSGAGALIICMMVANFLNFAFNAFLGRALSYEQFGSVIFYNTILNLVAICFGALTATLNHRVAYLNGKYGEEAGSVFMRFVRERAVYFSAGLIIIWMALAWFITGWFNLPSVSSVLLFSPIFFLGLVTSVNRGYLQGNLFFLSLGLTIMAEAFIKLSAAAALVFLHLESYVYLSIPISLLASFVLAFFLVLKASKSHIGENSFNFPKRFYTASLLNGLSTAAFLSMDVILAKHYLNPTQAGQYSLISLIGSMVYLVGSILNGFMITFVSHEAGEHRNPLKTFYILLTGAFVFTSLAVVAVGVFGSFTAPILFGEKAMPILPYLLTYTTAIALFTLSSVIISYHLARQHYSFSIAVLGIPLILCVGIFFRHGSLTQLVNVYFAASIVGASFIVLMHLLQRNGRFILRNLVDMLEIFKPLQKQQPLPAGGKRILVMNWRDMRHKYAGGAEVYVHELAKRWVSAGNQVTLFCGNDSKSTRNETIDGVRIIRHGGFYFVYFWAFIYYVTRFRGQFDVIIDCQNGIPFFTPLYAKEKVYCVMFHVHQEVFYKFLPKPAAFLASVLENRLMPYVYKRTKFITISESTKKDMEDIEMTGRGIDIIFPGVDLEALRPAAKSATPTILYLGRLKAYKSVDVLINAFKKISTKLNHAKLVIAGAGEEHDNLIGLVQKLGLGDRVEFKGKVTDEEKTALLQEAWVFVNPSMMEGWGITTIEANACGTPVIASDVPGLRDSIKNPHTGFLVEHGNVDAFAEKLMLVLEDDQMRSKMSNDSIEWSKQFNWNLSSQQGLKLLFKP